MKWTLVPIPSAASASIARARRAARRRSGDWEVGDPRQLRVRRLGSPRLRPEPDHEQVPGVARIVDPRREDEPPVRGTVRQPVQVSSGDRGTRLAELLGPRQLHEPERRGEVGQIVLEAGRLDLVVPRAAGRVALPGVAADPVQAHRTRPVRQRVVVGDEHPALAGRDGLRRVEAVRPGAADRPGEPAVEGRHRRGEGMGRVLDDRDARRRASRTPRQVGRQTGDVDEPRPPGCAT